MTPRIKAHRSGLYHSQFEVRFALDLDRRKIDYAYEADAFAYVIKRRYKPDWKLKNKSGAEFFVETKGYLTVEDRAKTLLVISQHPGIDLRMIFQNASNKIVPGSHTTYGMWCDKQGIRYAEGTIPEEWLNE